MINFFSNNKKIIKQQLDMIEYLIADNKRLRSKLERIHQRQGLEFGGSRLLTTSKGIQLTKSKKK